MNWNKQVADLIGKAWKHDAATGYWPEAHFVGPADNGGFESYYLFERADSEKRYFFMINDFIQKVLLDPAGIYTRQRNKQFLATIADKLAFGPLKTANLAEGMRIKCTPIRQISPKYREAVIDNINECRGEGILYGTVVEQDGYFPDAGSFYIYEVIMALDEGNHLWRPVSLTPEELEFKQKVEKEMRA